MEKGKYGLTLSFYAVMAFILAFLGQTTLCALLLGFVIIAEQNEWLTKQVIQAFFLTIFSSIVSSLISILNVFVGIPIIGVIISGVFGVITSIVSLIILIFVILALAKVSKGNEANIPFANKFANWAYGLIETKVYTNA